MDLSKLTTKHTAHAVITWRATREMFHNGGVIRGGDEMPADFHLWTNHAPIIRTGMVEMMVRLADGTLVRPPFQAARLLRAGGRVYRPGDVIPDVTAWDNFDALRRQRLITPVEDPAVLDTVFPGGRVPERKAREALPPVLRSPQADLGHPWPRTLLEG